MSSRIWAVGCGQWADTRGAGRCGRAVGVAQPLVRPAERREQRERSTQPHAVPASLGVTECRTLLVRAVDAMEQGVHIHVGHYYRNEQAGSVASRTESACTNSSELVVVVVGVGQSDDRQPFRLQ